MNRLKATPAMTTYLTTGAHFPLNEIVCDSFRVSITVDANGHKSTLVEFQIAGVPMVRFECVPVNLEQGETLTVDGAFKIHIPVTVGA